MKRLLVILALILLWHGLSLARLWDASLFPGPVAVFSRLAELARDGSLLASVSISLRRVLLGYLLSMAIGVPLGVALARSRWVDLSLGTVVAGVQALPSICWLPIALLWFGLTDRAILFVVVMGSMVSIAVAVQDGVKNLPPSYVRAAQTMGVTGPALAWRVLLPASLPTVLTAAKLGWAYAWRGLMAGELLFVSVGLGHLMMVGRELGDMSQVLGVMGVIVTVGLLTDRFVFNYLEAVVRERWGLDRA